MKTNYIPKTNITRKLICSILATVLLHATIVDQPACAQVKCDIDISIGESLHNDNDVNTEDIDFVNEPVYKDLVVDKLDQKYSDKYPQTVDISISQEDDNIPQEENSVGEDEYTVKDLIIDAIESYQQDYLFCADIQDIVEVRACDIDYVYNPYSRRINLFNSKYFDLLFGDHQYSLDELYLRIEHNPNIGDKYKPYMKEFTSRMLEYYTGVDTRVYAHNILTLKIVENAPKRELQGSRAGYNRMNNTIFITGELDLDGNETDRIVFRHEMGHMFNNYSTKIDDYIFTGTYGYNFHGKYVGEALDVLFTVEPYIDEYENVQYWGAGYPVTTNNVRVIVKYLGDYSFQDYVLGNIYTFEQRVNDKWPDIDAFEYYDFGYFDDILELQWVSTMDSDVSIDEMYYDNLYMFLAKLYSITTRVDTKDPVFSSMLYEELTYGMLYKPEYIKRSIDFAVGIM